MTHILISSDGKVKGSKTEPPGKPIIDEWSTEKNILDNYEISISLWKESCLEFEDQRVIQGYLPDSVFTRTEGDESALIPNTILSVELPETVEVEQYQYVNAPECGWFDYSTISRDAQVEPKSYRKILRFV